MKKVCALLALLFAMAFVPLAAAQAEPGAVTPGVIDAILGAALFGIPLAGLVEIVKRTTKKLLKIEGEKAWLGYASSGVVVAVLGVVTLSGLKMLTFPNFLTAFVIAWAVANGFYKVTVKAPAEKVAAEIRQLGLK
jgi:hypothetical protein